MKSRSIVAAAIALAALAMVASVPISHSQSRSDVVRLPIPKYDGTLTPYTFELAYPLMTLVYDTVMWRDANGVARPWLARSVSSTNGGRRVTVRLRDGLRWHDGRPLTAADVEFTFGFVARRYHPRFTPQLSDIAQVRTVSPNTVTFDLRRPSLGFFDQPLADVPILPRHLWQGLEGGTSVPGGLPVGSGPYRLARARRGSGYVFRANRGYFRGRPAIERIRVPIIRREAQTYAALRRRRVDMLPVSLPEDAAARLGGEFGINVRSGPLYTGTALLLNLRRPPFNRATLRRGVARALDLGRIVRNVGPAVAAERGYIHPASPWSSPSLLQRYDAGAARQALDRLDASPVRVLASESDPVRREAGRQVVLALQRAGFPAELSEVSRPALGQAIGEDAASPDFDAAIVETPQLASYDPAFLTKVFGSDARSSPLNYAGYRSRRFDALAARTASATDRDSRRRAVSAELRLLARDLPVVPLFFSRGAFAFRPAIHNGWVFVRGSGILDKRSFLATGPPEQQQERGSPGDESDDDSGGVLDVVSKLSLVVLAAVLVLAGVALARRRSLERR